MAEPKPPPSLQDFDYFNDDVLPLEEDDDEESEPVTLEEQLERYRRQTKRYSRFIMLMTVTIGVCIWFLSGYRDEMRYAFAAPHPPRALGDIIDTRPADIAHNSYVQLQGITEHRGLTQKRMRGLNLSRDEYWYFRFLGSGGVFIEALADKEVYGFATRLEVSGRAIDPARDESYAEILNHYHERFSVKRRPVLRVIQVGAVPGEGRLPYIVAFILVGLLAGSNLLALIRLVRARRRRAGQHEGPVDRQAQRTGQSR